MRPLERMQWGFRVLITYIRVQIGLRRHALPELVRRLASPHIRVAAWGPVRTTGNVYRVLRPLRPRCLVSSLVAFRILREEGYQPLLQIGLPVRPLDQQAHAWLEIDGRDVGPPPGRGGHEAIASYPIP